jgi:hypothetical protein
VDHPVAVRVAQRLGDLGQYVDELTQVVSIAVLLVEEFAHRETVYELHGEEVVCPFESRPIS